jgi:hypothetical protein
MATSSEVSKDGKLTPVSDKKGIDVTICDPGWFDEKKKFKIANAPERTAQFEFGGADLNYIARVLYAEASGAAQLTDKAERDKEKEAILNVKHFRLNRAEYPNRVYVAKSFREVCDAPGQFESVFKGTAKYTKSERSTSQTLNKPECSDLAEAIDAIKKFLSSGPNEEYLFDNFRGYNPSGRGTHIGRSRFWLSERGKELSDKTP